MEDEDLNISMILHMGFGDIGEIKRALRLSKGDLNEAVSILMDQPNPGYLSMDTDDINFKTEDEIFASSDSNEFPAHAVFELEKRVFQENWNIPYKREELLGVCLEASTRLAKEGTLEQNDAARKFLERILPEALRKLLTSNAIYRWTSEIQEGIYTMCEMFIDLIVARLTYEPVPIQLLQTLGQVFDYTIEWHSKNKEMNQRTWRPWRPWEDNGPSVRQVWAESSTFFQTRDRYGWLCDLINYFGEKDGFKLIRDIDKSREPLTAKVMSSMLMPLANCAPLLVQKTVKSYLSPCKEQAFKFSKSIDEDILKSKDMNYLHDLCHSLKVLCHNLWPNHEAECDAVRLEIIGRMLKTPHYNCRMNGLKEVCRLIEEADKKRNKYDISTQTVMEWMTENKILSVVLEGNIDQVQYTDKIKSMVEFLGPNLSSDEIRSIWNLGEEDSSHVMDNVHSILASASSRFNLTQLELINKLVNEKWAKSSTRIKEKLIALVGQIGKETVQNRVCPHWLNGKTCPFPAEKCFFKHTKDFMPLCQNWVEGKCIGGHGNSCSSRHYYMETDKNQNNQADTVKPAESVLTQFSSPLVQRNIKETKRLRRIHVDIETKCETSFTEEITEVIVDLTGQPPTPVRPAAQFIKKNLENIDPKDLAKEADSNKAFDIEELKENDNEEESNDNNNTTEVKEGECRYCVKMFKGMRGLRSHLTRNKVCGKKWKLDTRKSKIQNVEKSNSSISSNSSDLHTTASSTMMRESTIGSLLDSPSVESSSTMMRESTIGSLLDSPSIESSSAGSSLRNNQMLTSTPAPSKPDNSKSKERSCSTISNETTHTPTTTSRKRNSTLEVSLVHPSTKDSDNIRENQSVIEIIDDSEINGSTIIID